MAKGYIYKLIGGNNNLNYYGSTIQNIKNRFQQHKAPSNKSISKKLFEAGEVKLELVEEMEFNKKSELLDRERFYIENYECINKQKPNYFNSFKSKKEYLKVYQKKNLKRYVINNKKYKEKDRNKYNEFRRKYYLNRKINKIFFD